MLFSSTPVIIRSHSVAREDRRAIGLIPTRRSCFYSFLRCPWPQIDRITNGANDDERQIAACLFNMLESSIGGLIKDARFVRIIAMRNASTGSNSMPIEKTALAKLKIEYIYKTGYILWKVGNEKRVYRKR